jgi:hypothetical protein
MTGWDLLVIVCGLVEILCLAGAIADGFERRQARARDDWRWRR